jgi:hypothetical protein
LPKNRLRVDLPEVLAVKASTVAWGCAAVCRTTSRSSSTSPPAQQKKLDAIRAKYKDKMPKFTPGQRPTPEQMQKARPIFEAMRKEIDAVYTPKQKEIMKKYFETHMRRGPGGPGGFKPGGAPPVAKGGKKGGH